MAKTPKIAPCLWFATRPRRPRGSTPAIFKNSRIGTITRYGEAGEEIHGRPAGSVMTVEFELDGQRFTALNGGPQFKFNEAISFQVYCETKTEIDYYWEKLARGRRSEGAAVRLAQGQVRRVVAGGARGMDELLRGRESRARSARWRR